MRTPICKKKKKKEKGKEEDKNTIQTKERGAEKRGKEEQKKKKNLVVDRRINPVRGRGNGCPRLKVLQVPEKNAPPPWMFVI